MDQYVTCPYNSNHRPLKFRLQCHLAKCPDRDEINFETCPFNATHIYRKGQKESHFENCESRGDLERNVYQVGNSSTRNNEVLARSMPPPRINNENEESWDDYDAPTYHPQQYAMNANVLRNAPPAPPAERRRFAENERRRLSGIQRRQN
ncbi:gametocyte-specific factor 1 homolog [Contarinia nasturtii]|uniref:gametocyte-specific factor 1 homolog n=1 Tax=Contarinia nasturtii TaxID=265458 RepID=UPI0012D3F414|nr:gametocyte-specific factor 1 homolog [Contarinia nasturtii]